MRVRCINNQWLDKVLTIGKEYDVIKDCGVSYSLIDDLGNKAEIDKVVFEEIAEDKPTGIPTFDGDISKQVGGSHYNKNDPIQFARDNYPPEHLEGFYRINVDKYMARYDKKNGIEDIKKAKHYIDMLLELKEMEDAE